MGTSRRATLLLGEDHPETARALVRLLGQDFDIVGVIASGEELIELSDRLQPDAIVSDIGLQRLDGVSAVRTIRQRWPTLPIVLISADNDPIIRSAAVAAGASAFLPKIDAVLLPLLLRQILDPVAARVGLIGASDDELTDRVRSDHNDLRQENEHPPTIDRELANALDLLRESEERLRLAVEAAHIGVWEWDIALNRVTWDAKKHDVFGLAAGSFAGTAEAFFDLVHPDDRLGLQAAITDTLDRGAPYQNEFRISGPGGSTRWIANLGQVYRDDDGRPVRMIGVVCDVTERKLTERALRDSEQWFRALVETTGEWIWAIDRHATITYSNPTVEAILGYRPDELVGQSLRTLVHDEDFSRVAEIVATATAEKRGWSAFVVRCRHKNQTYRHLECQGVPILDDNGEVVGFRGSDRDVTDRVHAEETMRDAHRMEGIGWLANGFAHHFDNLLTVIVGHVEMASELAGREEVRTDLQAIRRAAHRGALLTRQLRVFAGKQFIQPTPVNLNDHIEHMRSVLQRLLGDEIELMTEFGPEPWMVKADPQQLRTLLVNFAVNAQEAMPDGGTVTISTANIAADDSRALREAEVMPGDCVMLAFADTGTGMTKEIARRVFEPFFSTKGTGADSAGFGLSTCYGIVAQHGGHIRLATEPDEGSTFRVYLPRFDPSQSAPRF